MATVLEPRLCDIRWCLSAPFGMVQVGVEAHNNQVVLLCSHILVGIVKVQSEASLNDEQLL